MQLQIRVSTDGIIEDAKLKLTDAVLLLLHHFSQNGFEESPLTKREKSAMSKLLKNYPPACKDTL